MKKIPRPLRYDWLTSKFFAGLVGPEGKQALIDAAEPRERHGLEVDALDWRVGMRPDEDCATRSRMRPNPVKASLARRCRGR